MTHNESRKIAQQLARRSMAGPVIDEQLTAEQLRAEFESADMRDRRGPHSSVWGKNLPAPTGENNGTR